MNDNEKKEEGLTIETMAPYRVIAKDALINWNGLSEEEASQKVKSESIDELEGQVFAMDSVKHATRGIANSLGLSEEEYQKFADVIVNGPMDDDIIKTVREKSGNIEDINEFAFSVLTVIHDGWVIDNSSEKTFNKKVEREQLRQYNPIELIGWNEARSDLLFLGPILEGIGVDLDEQKLKDKYHEHVGTYFQEMKISGKDSLESLISQGSDFYPALPEELSERLVPYSGIITKQLEDNWENKDKTSARLFYNQQSKPNNKNLK